MRSQAERPEAEVVYLESMGILEKDSLNIELEAHFINSLGLEMHHILQRDNHLTCCSESVDLSYCLYATSGMDDHHWLLVARCCLLLAVLAAAQVGHSGGQIGTDLV
ncbi:uncharacterized protein LOC144455025 isoform X2 [Phascolarctos cinereus]